MGASAAIKLTNEIPYLIDKLVLLSPAGLFGKSQDTFSSSIGTSFLGLPRLKKSL